MRHIILKDTKITAGQYEDWKEEDTAFWQKYVDITPEYTVLKTEYSNYPTYVDSDGDIRPTNAYLQSLTDLVIAKNGQFGYDFIMVMVHEDNWKSDTDFTEGIWGTNYSYAFGSQNLCYCRWDKDNRANTFGVAYHERHHSFDAIIKVELGVNIEPILDVQHYDREITHGKGADWSYIRHKENTKSLEIMKPYLQQAFKKRKEKHDEFINGLLQTILNLATQLLYFLRKQMNAKNGIPR